MPLNSLVGLSPDEQQFPAAYAAACGKSLTLSITDLAIITVAGICRCCGQKLGPRIRQQCREGCAFVSHSPLTDSLPSAPTPSLGCPQMGSTLSAYAAGCHLVVIVHLIS